MKLKKHHTALGIMAVVFLIAWAIWTFVLVPSSATPLAPQASPVAPAN